ncbi:uncharacterized protein LOC136081383 [Hydra vulgaris]|uniref:Uncharacterized protein LOC136081383 n=1 Tax=Hydra vulgaris TaxID=6087 RepID=A0ABM4BZU5_HYDVU
MPKGKPISVEKRTAILTLLQEGYTVRKIAENLNLSKSTVSYTIRQYRESGSLEDRNRPGPSRITTKTDDRRIKIISKHNRMLTAPQITAIFNCDREKKVSVSTIKRRLQKANLHGRVAIRKPYLRKVNRQKRFR